MRPEGLARPLEAKGLGRVGQTANCSHPDPAFHDALLDSLTCHLKLNGPQVAGYYPLAVTNIVWKCTTIEGAVTRRSAIMDDPSYVDFLQI